MEVTFDVVPADEFPPASYESLHPKDIRICKVVHESDPPKYALVVSHSKLDPSHPSFAMKDHQIGIILDERSLLLIAQAIQGHFRPTVESRTLDVLEKILKRLDAAQ